MIPDEMYFVQCVDCNEYKENWIGEMDFYKEVLASKLCHECHEISVQNFNVTQEEQRQRTEEQSRKDDQLRRLHARRSRKGRAGRVASLAGRTLPRYAAGVLRGSLSSSVRIVSRIASYVQRKHRSFQQYQATRLPLVWPLRTEFLRPIATVPGVAALTDVHVKSEEDAAFENLEQKVANRKHLAVLRAREARAQLESKVFLAQVNGEHVDPNDVLSLMAD